MTALGSRPAHDARALDRWTRVVEALGARVVAEGRAEMPCPVHGGDKPNGFAISVGDDGWPKLYCRTKGEGCEDQDGAWYGRAREVLVAAGAPADALRAAKGGVASQRLPAAPAARRAGARQAVGRLPGEQRVEAWCEALMRDRMLRHVIKSKWHTDDEALAWADVGWDEGQGRYTFPVRDEAGEIVQVVYRDFRDDPPAGAPKSRTHKGVTGSHLYAPFGITDGERVVLCAGEKDTFAAHGVGLNAVTMTNGEHAAPPPERLSALRGREVTVAYDNDDAGRTGARRIAAAVAAVAAKVWIADLSTVPGLPDKGDLSDVLAMDGGERLLREALNAAPPWEGQAEEEPDDLRAAIEAEFLVNADDAEDHFAHLLDDEQIAALPPVEYVIDGWLPAGQYSVVYGEPGIGKTLALLGMTRAVRRGTRWQDNKTRQGATIFYQGEGLAQLRDRIAAWDDQYPLRPDQSMQPGRTTDLVLDLTKVEGVVAVARTVRRLESAEECRVRLLVIDPLVEYMTGEENGEGMALASLGLRALAKVLGCAVVVGHHSNASGERERGAAFLRMRAGAFIRMERLDEAGQRVGVMQQKQRNGDKQALVLNLVAAGRSVVLEWQDALLAQDYIAQKESAARKEREAAKEQQAASKRSDAEKLLLHAVGEQPGVARNALLTSVLGRGCGKPALEDALTALMKAGRVRTEAGPRDAQMHYLAD